jgi:peptide/nickel transport system substrate-binding protein
MVVTSQRGRSENIVNLFAENLRACGIGVSPILEQAVDIYAPGPDGRIFGRNFDLAQITWMAGSEPPCSLYLTEQIPSAENFWIGANVGGYSNAAYDQACQLARSARPDALDIYETGHLEAQRIFLEEVPAIPLYFNLHAGATRVDFCNFSVNRAARSDAWNIEEWDISAACIEVE